MGGSVFYCNIKGQLFAKDPKFQKTVLSGDEEPKESFTEKSKYIFNFNFCHPCWNSSRHSKEAVKLFPAPSTTPFGNFSPAHEVPTYLCT